MFFNSDENHRFDPCPSFLNRDTDDNIVVCEECKQYTARCCQHPHKPCHAYRLVFADGACLGNGLVGARGGIGVALGADDELRFSKPFRELEMPNSARTSQIAELKAAIEAVNLIDWFHDSYGPQESSNKRQKRHKKKKRVEEEDEETETLWIIAMDSEYVVKGVTTWFPDWKANGWKNSKGSMPANLNLFISLKQKLADLEKKRGINICFWHISRVYNTVADELAKIGAQLDA
ncbi:hypothetical protein AA313_de0207206 [Arthrobotrys entomopaga]|nr:hypothetical protein AA313_de0207206 [Arthrobotrys entomopaga]